MKKTNLMKKVGLYKRFSSVFMIIILVFSGTLTLLPVLLDEAIPNAQGTVIDNIFFDDMEAGGPADSGKWAVVDSVLMNSKRSSYLPLTKISIGFT